MALARLLAARTLTLPRAAAGLSSALRHRTSRALSAKVEFVEIDLSEESPSSSSGGGGAGDSAKVQAQMGMRRLEDAIHGVLVRRAAPDWLPFVPGASYWVPPMPRPLGVADLLGAAVHTARGATAMTAEEAMSFTTVRGWPSAAYFVEGKFSHPVKRPRNDATQTDDEES
ncbi:hypothetical protein SEVIR_7G240700v4 [Setaria viridis]|uniref:Uncharacterized protein n=2 Tax=Setaria TaxID=4554 RepID=K3YAD8_SETIT|nr:uncharacterized protein LOC101754407 [Setaria italica]XP_034602981.1 uncharacterized protein LOC117863400 [Setaria viridis]RCV35294.1 hypothetical protein SETIT_7G229300v2 [Setaria italica]TKW06406.1 hypothetical protein SEVIR_7G240700v2 [Setaria viridis]